MELFNIIIILIIVYCLYKISEYKNYKEKIDVITLNADKINYNNEQIVNVDAIKGIKTVTGDPDIFISSLKKSSVKNTKYTKMVALIDQIKGSMSEIAGEQYAMDKTQNETNRVPHELNLIQLGKLEYNIKDKAKSLAKESKTFDSQIQSVWFTIILVLIVAIYINLFRDTRFS